MNVLLVNRFFHPDPSGTARMLTDLAEDLAAAGHRVTVLTSDAAAMDPGARYPGRGTWRGVAIRRVRAGRFDRQRVGGWALNAALFYPGVVRALLATPAHDVTVFLTDPPLLFALGLLVRLVKGGRIVVWSQDVYPDVAVALGVLHRWSPLTRIWNRLARWGYTTADRVVAIGDVMKARLARKGIPAGQIAVCPNWADGRRVRPVAPGANPFRRRLGLGGRFVVGYSGNLGLSHEFGTLLGAARRLADRRAIAFLLIGGGKQAARVRALAGGNVTWRPFQPESALRFSLSAPDVHVVTLKPGLEGALVPSKLYGALAAGRPVLFVGPRASEVARTIRAGRCGVTVEPGDVAGLARAIARLADRPAERRRMGRAARELFRTTFDRPVRTRALAALVTG